MTKLKLEVGKYYRTRDGRKVGPMEYWPKRYGSFKYGVGEPRYSSDGFDGWERDCDTFGDLIEEWTDTPEVGTLAEIGAQIGDVVAYYWDHGCVTQLIATGEMINEWVTDSWRIVSRASDAQSPIELTMKQSVPQLNPVQLRKVIVPGVYGKVEVSEDDSYGGGTGIYINSTFSRDDLIAARDVFNALIDAMEAPTNG